MKKLLMCLAVCLSLFCFVLPVGRHGVFCYGEEYQIYEGYLPDYGNYYRNGQLYEDYLPIFGNTIKPHKTQNNKQQIYEGYVPKYGSYYDWKGQLYEDYVPKYGEKIKRR